jgi:transcriptional regulator with XRE-family HTH domain
MSPRPRPTPDAPRLIGPDPWEFKRRQVKAARVLLGWTQEDLARMAGVGISTLRDFERASRKPYRWKDISRALAGAGVVFTEHGVELPRPDPGVTPD